MKKREALRGHAAFARLFARGTRLDGDLLRCFFIREPEERARLHVGYAVSSRALNAVQRNRVRRLMREAFAREQATLVPTLESPSGSLSILFQFKTKNSQEVKRLRLAPVHQDVSKLCRSVAARLLHSTP